MEKDFLKANGDFLQFDGKYFSCLFFFFLKRGKTLNEITSIYSTCTIEFFIFSDTETGHVCVWKNSFQNVKSNEGMTIIKLLWECYVMGLMDKKIEQHQYSSFWTNKTIKNFRKIGAHITPTYMIFFKWFLIFKNVVYSFWGTFQNMVFFIESEFFLCCLMWSIKLPLTKPNKFMKRELMTQGIVLEILTKCKCHWELDIFK